MSEEELEVLQQEAAARRHEENARRLLGFRDIDPEEMIIEQARKYQLANLRKIRAQAYLLAEAGIE